MRLRVARFTSAAMLDPCLCVKELVGQGGELCDVVADRGEDLVGHGVAEEGARQAAVERPATQREEQALLRWCESRKRDAQVSVLVLLRFVAAK